MAKGTCSYEDCDGPHYARGWCLKHYYRWKRTGDPAGRKPADPLIYIERTDDCWYWTGPLDRQGYGSWHQTRPPKTQRAHRVVYKLLIGPIPGDLPLDHDCHNRDLSCSGGPTCRHRACVRPEDGHNVPRTLRANLLLGRTLPAAHAAKTHCVMGHPYDAANTYVYTNKRGIRMRFCRACKKRWR